MGRTAVAFVFIVGSGLACSAGGTPAGEAAVTVRVHRAPGLGGAWPDQAAGIAADIFQQAGVSVGWISCTGRALGRPECTRAPAPTEFVVRIRAARDHPGSQGCGVSLQPVAGSGHYVTIFHDCIAAAADELGLAEAVVGAHVIAHEIGHLLLPAGHAMRGLMRETLDGSDWSLAARENLRFTPDEARQIHDGIRRRLAVAGAAAVER